MGGWNISWACCHDVQFCWGGTNKVLEINQLIFTNLFHLFSCFNLFFNDASFVIIFSFFFIFISLNFHLCVANFSARKILEENWNFFQEFFDRTFPKYFFIFQLSLMIFNRVHHLHEPTVITLSPEIATASVWMETEMARKLVRVNWTTSTIARHRVQAQAHRVQHQISKQRM